MKNYRYLTGPDDAHFCQRVTDALNNGWELYGNPTLTYDSKQQRVICGQVIVKQDEENSKPTYSASTSSSREKNLRH